MNPFGEALLAYHEGQSNAFFSIVRDDGFTQTVPVDLFFDTSHFSGLENRALGLCFGEVLDVGAAAGRHSLELTHRGLATYSLDILPETRKILSERGVAHPITGDVLSWTERSFDTVLMLMNGIGLVGTPRQLDAFLLHAHRLLSPGGQILCDSIDVFATEDPVHVLYRDKNRAAGLYPGQQRFTIQFEGNQGEPFEWLHLDFASLAEHCATAEWNCRLIDQESDGHYLARIFKDA